MSSNFAAMLANLLRVADHLDENASGVGHVIRRSLEPQRRGAAWGYGKSGKEFESGYLQQTDFVNKNIDAKLQLLEGYGGGIRGAAGIFAQRDES